MTTNDRTGATPGPWAFDHDWHRLPTIFGADGVTKVAIVEKVSGPHRTPEQEANARLIAAAPALLKALRAVERARHTDESSDWARATTLTDAAIAQATGGHHDL